MSPRQTDKRSRLVRAAQKTMHEQGFNRTTLADIASAADVPLGNVYYYFKTKEAIGQAVVESHLESHEAARREWDKLADPRARIEAFIKMTVDNRHGLVRSGCAVGTLCSELGKDGGGLAREASQIFAGILAWLEAQFRELGHGTQEARDLAGHVLAVLQGVSLLANAFQSPGYVTREAARLKAWLRGL